MTDKMDEYVDLKLELQKQMYILKILSLQSKILRNEEASIHDRTTQYDILGEAIRLIREEVVRVSAVIEEDDIEAIEEAYVSALYKQVKKYGWKIREYGPEDAFDQEKVAYYILEKERQWIYVNLWSNGKQEDDTTSFSPNEGNESMEFTVDELNAITTFIHTVKSIDVFDKLDI